MEWLQQLLFEEALEVVAIGIGTWFGSLQNIFCNTPDGPAVVVCCKSRHALDEDLNSTYPAVLGRQAVEPLPSNGN